MQAAQHLHFWSEEVVRGKLLPLLMQWDMCHPDSVSLAFAECSYSTLLGCYWLRMI